MSNHCIINHNELKNIELNHFERNMLANIVGNEIAKKLILSDEVVTKEVNMLEIIWNKLNELEYTINREIKEEI